jgi:hypothetical protein
VEGGSVKRVRIESNGDVLPPGSTRVFIDDVDVTSSVYAVSWRIAANEASRAEVTFVNVEVKIEGGLAVDDELIAVRRRWWRRARRVG